MELHRSGTPRNLRFWGTCSCGEVSESAHAAGMIHGWHGEHREKVGDLIVCQESLERVYS
jgi:hypothetical protein